MSWSCGGIQLAACLVELYVALGEGNRRTKVLLISWLEAEVESISSLRAKVVGLLAS